jgi:hypothetical protein
MASSITIPLSESSRRGLEAITRRRGQTVEEVACDAIERFLGTTRFAMIREQTVPLAEAAGYAADEDVFRVVS